MDHFLARPCDRNTGAGAPDARFGSYRTLEGNIVSHPHESYYMFRDSTGEMRVKIPPGVVGGQQSGPQDTVRIMGALDCSIAGRYIWVKSLQAVN